MGFQANNINLVRLLIILLFLSGCPLIGFKPEMTEKLESLTQADREVICAGLCYIINWFREV